MGRWDGYVKAKCAAPGCEELARTLGLCGKHHMRMKRRGELEPESMRAPVGAPAAFVAAALASRTDDCIVWPYARTHIPEAQGGGKDRDYAQAKLDGRTRCVHVYVCEKTHGPAPEGMEAAHSCGRQPCINPRHLRWATREENQADRVLHGTSNRGERQWGAKLREQDVIAIKRQAQKGRLWQRAAAERYGVGRKTISDIVTGKTWAWLTLP